MPRKTNLSIRLRTSDLEKIKQIAAEKDYYPTELIRKVIENYINNYNI